MNILHRSEFLASILRKETAITLILAILFWTVGIPSLVRTAHASQVSNFSDTLSDSNNGNAAKHVLSFTATSAVNPNATLKISLDPLAQSIPGTSAFTENFSAASSSDFSIQSVLGAATTTYSIVNTCGGSNQATVAASYNGGSDENLTFTLCNTAAVIATSSVVTLTVGSTTPVWYNPAATGSYTIRLGGTSGNTGDTRVAILSNVKVTASIDTTFTFTVAGLATSTTFNSITTTGSTTATALPFNTLVPTASSTLGQELRVTTNSRNGFAVTVQENQPLTSSVGAIINLFSNGATTTTPIAWTKPTNTINQPNTYSHLGISSDDADEGGTWGNYTSGEFYGAKYAGNIINPRTVFTHYGPSDGVTQNVGLAHVFYTIEIGTLQSAGNDYTNTLTYVATPTF